MTSIEGSTSTDTRAEPMMATSVSQPSCWNGISDDCVRMAKPRLVVTAEASSAEPVVWSVRVTAPFDVQTLAQELLEAMGHVDGVVDADTDDDRRERGRDRTELEARR